jgi:Uma2 family endonuclease
MSTVTTPGAPLASEDELYPTRDGQPMAETELHGDEMTELKLMLRRHFEPSSDRTYVGCNLFVYYEEGNPRAVFSPDVFVVFGAPQRQRDTYKLWVDGPAPSWVIEVTSKSTRVEDKGNKKAVCEMLGVAEYFLYDPCAEYLEPPLQGFRLAGAAYRPISLDDRGELPSETLGLSFFRDKHGLIALRDRQTGRMLLRVDAERRRLENERKRLEGERDTERNRANAERKRFEGERKRAEVERTRLRAERDAERQRADAESERAKGERERAQAAERRLAEVLAEVEKRR